MKFVVGGQCTGKLAFVLNKFNVTLDEVGDCTELTYEELKDKAVIYNLHILIKKLLEENDSTEVFNMVMDLVRQDKIVITNEIGYGVVPIERFDRQYRELTGRICCKIAEESKEVYRVVCGIGSKIKDEAND